MIFRVLNQILEVSKSGKGPNWVLFGHVWTFLVALIDTYEILLGGLYIRGNLA